MTKLSRYLIVAGAALTSAVPGAAMAQVALDRVDPLQAERERERQPEALQAQPKVEVEADPRNESATARGSVLVGAVTFAGLRVLSPSDFADVIVSRVGSTMNPAELAALATAVADRARAKGYPFASAWIEPQRMANGVLTVSVDEGVISEIRFEGPAPASVRQALAPLANQRPVPLAQLERSLLLAGDIDGVQIKSSRFLREAGRGILLVRVAQDRLAFRAQLSNEGTRPLGPAQVRVDADLNALLFSDDSATITYSTTPAEPDELQFVRARYAKRITSAGTELGITGLGSRTRPGAYLVPLDLESRSWFVGVDLLQPLLRQRRVSLWLQGEIGIRDLKQWQQDTLVRHDRVTAARLTLYGYADFAGGRLRVSSTMSRGLGWFEARSEEHSLNSSHT